MANYETASIVFLISINVNIWSLRYDTIHVPQPPVDALVRLNEWGQARREAGKGDVEDEAKVRSVKKLNHSIDQLKDCTTQVLSQVAALAKVKRKQAKQSPAPKPTHAHAHAHEAASSESSTLFLRKEFTLNSAYLIDYWIMVYVFW